MNTKFRKLLSVMLSMFVFVGVITTPVLATEAENVDETIAEETEVVTEEEVQEEVAEPTEEIAEAEEPAGEVFPSEETITEMPAETEDQVNDANGEASALDLADLNVLEAEGELAEAEDSDDIDADDDVRDGEEDSVPKIKKSLIDDEDGTYTIELSVTGDADTEVETAANVNVLIIYDESSSMTSNNVTTNPNRNRADYAEDVMHDFIASLRRYQSGDGSNIQVALVGFGPNATTRQGWTSNLADTGQGINRFFDDGVDGTVTSSHNYGSNNGTNWQAALNQALTILNGDTTDSDPTFVILVTDGAPTAASGQTTINPAGNRPWTDFRVYYNAATTNARSIQSRDNTTLFGIYAYGTEADLLDDLIYYSNTGEHRTVDGYSIANATAQQHNFGATEEADNYFNASDTAQLNTAIESIFQTIVQALGISSASISDGTTHEVATSTGVADLLEVDESTYKYWISIPIVGGQFQRVNLTTGETETFTVTDNGDKTCTVTWGSNSVTVNGSVSAGQFKYQWTEANALYNFAPPKAKMTNGAVDWDLAAVGTLLDGVTYSVTFECYPSQYTLDLIADLKNGYQDYDKLDPNIQLYLSEDYELSTNTTATLTYTDTRNDEGEKTKIFDNPDPEEVPATKALAVSKKWNNTLDDNENWKTQSINLWVTRDGEERYEIVLNNDNNWTNSAYISFGILTKDSNGIVDLKTTGHDYSFAESVDIGHNWVLEAPTVRPMLVNSAETMLVEIDAADAPAELTGSEEPNISNSDGTYYKLTIDNETKYYVVDETTGSLTATNHRRSYLDVKKAITGNVPEDTEFEFTIKVDTKAEDADPDNTSSDAWVWFSLWDTANNVMVKNPDAATANGLRWQIGETEETLEVVETKPSESDFNGYFLAPSNTDITVTMKKQYNLRFLNLPVGAEYTVTETDSSEVASFSSIAGERGFDEDGKEETTDDWTTEPAGTVTGESLKGTIEYPESAYKVTVTNVADAFYVYHSSDNTIEKIEMDDSRVTLDEESGTYQFNIVAETKADYLYGGYYTDYKGAIATDEQINETAESGTITYTDGLGKDMSGATPYSYDYIFDENREVWLANEAYTENGKTMKPVSGGVYYLKEVPNGYLLPYTHYTYYKANGNLSTLYEMSAIDDACYQSVYFVVTVYDDDKIASVVNSVKISATHTASSKVTLNAAKVFGSKGVKAGWLCYTKDLKNVISNKSADISQYWITLDGVKVFGIKTRQLSGANNKSSITKTDVPYVPAE